MANWSEGRVVENTRWTDNLFTLKVDAEPGRFRAGQFVSLGLDLDGERVARPYTFISAPHERPLEFFLYTVEHGRLSPRLRELQAGDRLWLREGCNGFFVLDEVPAARTLWMLGTGAGIAPFLSMLKTDEAWEKFSEILLVQAVRTRSDLLYQETIAGFRERFGERFVHQPIVSREDAAGCLRGRIPAMLEDRSLEAALDRPLGQEHSQIMLCGNPGMVTEGMEALKARGFRKNRRRTPGQVTTENYW